MYCFFCVFPTTLLQFFAVGVSQVSMYTPEPYRIKKRERAHVFYYRQYSRRDKYRFTVFVSPDAL